MISRQTSRSIFLPVMLILLAVGTVGSASSEANAEAIIALGGKDQVVTDDSYDLLSDDQFLSAGHLSVSVGIVEGVFVGLEYVWASEDFEPFRSTHNVFELDGFFVKSRLEHQVASFFTPYGSLGAGVYYADLLATVSGAEREQQLWLPAVSGLVGAELTVPPILMRRILGISKSSVFSEFTVGFSLEIGYEWMLNADFDDLQVPEPDKEPDPEDRPIEPHGLTYGDVDMSGLMMRSALVFRF